MTKAYLRDPDREPMQSPDIHPVTRIVVIPPPPCRAVTTPVEGTPSIIPPPLPVIKLVPVHGIGRGQRVYETSASQPSHVPRVVHPASASASALLLFDNNGSRPRLRCVIGPATAPTLP